MKLPELRIGDLKPRFPIIQGGMAVRVSTASLAGAVAKAGGIGLIGATGMTLDELREEIRKARALAGGGIIGVNIMYAARQFAELVQTAISEGIDTIFTGAGFSRDIFRWGKESGVPIVSIVSSVKAARMAEKFGAAAVVAEGTEAGGHLGTDRSVKEIVPEIKEKVNIPVIAAGGIVSGQDMADMVKLGASGVQMATRFVLSEECSVSDKFKQMYLQAKEEDVVVIKSPVGLPGRAIKNPFVEALQKGQAPEPKECEGCLKACSREYCIMKALTNSRDGLVNDGVVFAGKNVFKIKDILPVAEIFNRLLTEYAAAT
ncbi:NAD(P)H-dependent flavin oxidoreductase YrpB (nitropropane dioxygenase family) [Desulfohalotomaculum tongense]|uniref:NAD(P)H-dependent flavin oxidoreductase n=1 Tax=Desulforadius tongensis TaxID=1216062 RepID=UPI00195614D7|nr:nitronate monooxygenase [Desulforadius tongensis]MBM7853966.1 NAD(P)H-dependent flavin oxidoreductase YrpB (nitropropane dioxygenase family) [Desulforadius tongensis]